MSPQVPALPPEWPPDHERLYAVMTVEHWQIEAVAFDVLRKRATREQLDQLAVRLYALADLLRRYEPGA